MAKHMICSLFQTARIKPFATAFLALCFLIVQTAVAGVVEEFAVVYGPPEFGRLPWIQGNRVVWRRYRSQARPEDSIQSKDISFIDKSFFEVASYTASLTGVVLAPEYLLRGAINGFAHGSPVIARRISELDAGTAADIHVSQFGQGVGASSQYVIIKVNSHQDERFNRKFLAKLSTELGDESLDSLRPVTGFKDVVHVLRPEAVSERYFVWQDHEPDSIDSWKVYAKRMTELLVPGAEFLVLDTNMRLQSGTYSGAGVQLALHDSLLLVQAAENRSEDSSWGLLLVDLNAPNDRQYLALHRFGDGVFSLDWPALSDEYAVWMSWGTSFARSGWAQRLVDRRPSGAPFEIGPGGTEITIDRNVAIWMGRIRLDGEEDYREAVMAAELDLPGAEDVGDADQSGRIDLTDAVVILQYLFASGPRPRLRVADADLNRKIEITDAVRILSYLFRGEQRPGVE